MRVNHETGAPFCNGCGQEMKPSTEEDRAKHPKIDYVCHRCPSGYTSGAAEQVRLGGTPEIDLE